MKPEVCALPHLPSVYCVEDGKIAHKLRLVVAAASGHLSFGAIGARVKMAHLLYAGRLLKKAKMTGSIPSHLPSAISFALQGPESWGCDLLPHSSRGVHVGASSAMPSSFQVRAQSEYSTAARATYVRFRVSIICEYASSTRNVSQLLSSSLRSELYCHGLL